MSKQDLGVYLIMWLISSVLIWVLDFDGSFSVKEKIMQEVIKTVCDICGKEMPSQIYSKLIKDYNFCILSYGKVWDVCIECRNELNEWMKKRKAKSENT